MTSVDDAFAVGFAETEICIKFSDVLNQHFDKYFVYKLLFLHKTLL